ncbi:MFS transporter [Cupriavidus consociatus]|uniref:MFS transporter n=1 Tax=Cupriavidus consociatus TaxID=2821357 RepID=UPI001AEB07ED|nr:MULTISPECIES: MFS transporter [unclassified Cupriavidus]MBP0623699.1 MFS transporter [Cupriavidus sp. LEh25]MDK2660403.1 MFS transporter [Cupriavidus sp. LEh21]
MRQIDIDIQRMAGEARLNGFHYGVLGWCALIIVFDGYDLAVAGIALPLIMKEMQIEASQAGFLVSTALFGMMFGNILLGTISERIGRRLAIAVCVGLFSVFTAAAGLCSDPLLFGAARFLAGIGIGGVMPNVIAQMTEYAPRRVRSTMVTLMFSGYSVGGMLAAVLGKNLIVSYGWQSVFLAAGLPVLLIPLILKWMPESVPFLIRRGRTDDLRRLAQRIDPNYRAEAGDRFIVAGTDGAVGSADAAAAAPIGQLFHQGRALSTLMFWLSCFMCLFMVYALSSWLTKLMASAGYSLGSALTFVLVLNLGGMIGAIGGGWLADRFHIKYVLIGMYVLAAVSITLLGHPVPTAGLYLLVALAGASTIGTQIVGCAYAGQFYPVNIRATGIGWTLGMGRGGAILAPILIGFLVSMGLPLEQNFMAIAVPALVAALAVLMIDHGRSASALTGPGEATHNAGMNEVPQHPANSNT